MNWLKYIFGSLLTISLNVSAQNYNAVYSSDKRVVKICLPAEREIYGGTIIKAIYTKTDFNAQEMGAFEYACKLVEECMPTTCPINIKVEFSDAIRNGALAVVQPMAAKEGMCGTIDGRVYDKMYAKRYMQLWSDANGPEGEDGLKFYRDSEDATIKFASKDLFSFSLDTTDIKSDKYDFVTVAIQALIKAIGFTCNAYVSDNKLSISPTQANKFTYTILNNDPSKNYQLAISNNAYLGTDYSNERWLLECKAPYRQGISLNYMAESDDEGTAIMQYGISKGSYIRKIGDFMKTFFTMCEWDRPIVTGTTGDNYNVVFCNTSDVISYKGIVSNSKASNNIKISSPSPDELKSYLRSVAEVGEVGKYVLLKDGTWRTFENLTNLNDSNAYARSVDGFLRIKDIKKEIGVNGQYSNLVIHYYLYNYIPQKAKAGLVGYTISQDNLQATNARRKSVARVNKENTYLDVTIGVKNTEGTDYIVVEQTDADYPVPYSYVIDNPRAGTFVAYMSKEYPSTFKLTYVNSNGENIGEPFTVDLRPTSSGIDRIDKTVELYIKENAIKYNINMTGSIRLMYAITDLTSGRTVLNGTINQPQGNINISLLPRGTYSISVYNINSQFKKLIERKWVK
ncbi:MAG TPA: hypothetical protein DEQ27_07755 [Prevotella sp.]|nr:hypothetical protein [Prevotella sp.]